MATSTDAPDNSNDFGEIIVSAFKMVTDSWEAFKLNWVTFLILLLIPMLLVWAVVFAMFAAFSSGSTASYLIAFFIGVVVFIVACILAPATIVTQLASAKGKAVEFSEVFEKSKSVVVPFIGLALLSALVIGVGLILFIVPGLIAAFFLVFSSYILVDKKLGIIESMKASYELVKANWEWVVALLLVQLAVSVVSYIPLVGWIAGLALTVAYFCLPALVYLKITKK